jgi:hypothetical protein
MKYIAKWQEVYERTVEVEAESLEEAMAKAVQTMNDSPALDLATVEGDIIDAVFANNFGLFCYPDLE